jgi:uncharacterized protein
MIARAHDATAVPMPAIGIGLRSPHVSEVIATRPAIDWLEVHAENYFGGGPGPARLDTVRRDYALSLHGIGLSLGTCEGLDSEHLARLKQLIERAEPFIVSDHLSWSVTGGTYLSDLLPLPYTEESLAVVAENVDLTQSVLGRRLLVENPSSYLRYRHSTIPEPEFLREIACRTGCGLLCDVNNIFVTCSNLDLDAEVYLDALPSAAVGEIHLAGHSRVTRGGQALLIDDHGSPVAPPVWDIYRRAIACFGPVPTLIEWDSEIPALGILLGEARVAAVVAQSELDAHDYAA